MPNNNSSNQIEQERNRIRQANEARAEQHKRSIKNIIIFIIILCVIASVGIFFLTRTSVNYTDATNTFLTGDYALARERYSALGKHKDSPDRVILCDSLIALQEGRTEDAVTQLEGLSANENKHDAQLLESALHPIMISWRDMGLTPQALLLLLSKTTLIDPNGKLDVATLSTQAHIALLDSMTISSYVDDINHDGEEEIIVLTTDYAISAYRMAQTDNVKMAIDNSTTANCAMYFGNQYKETNLDHAIACFSEAHRLMPTDETRTALSSAYHKRALARENAGTMQEAILDAQKAMKVLGTEDTFTFYYDMNLRYCKNGNDLAAAITMWNDFATTCVSEITKYSATKRWQQDASLLHIAYATALAAEKDALCIAELQTAIELGADVRNTVTKIKSYFDPGLTLAQLHLMEMNLFSTEPNKVAQIQATMASEVRSSISEWQARGIPAIDVPALIYFADQQAIDLSGIQRDSIYADTALLASGNIKQHTFVDWNHDGYQELLTVDETGKLVLYGINGTWQALSIIDTKISSASFVVVGDDTPLILLTSAIQDELLVVRATGTELNTLFRETGISRYVANGDTITFSKALAGSIARYSNFVYEPTNATNRPIRTGVDWQQNDYPYPKTASETIQRFFEARVYDISEEMALLTTDNAISTAFNANTLLTLPAPTIPVTVTSTAYAIETDTEWYEITYDADTQAVRSWVVVTHEDSWKIAGASHVFAENQSLEGVNYSLPLLGLNVPNSNAIATKNTRNTYRVFIPTAGRLSMLWQSGEKNSSQTAYTATMQANTVTGDSVFTYHLKPSLNKQQSKDMFVSAGVYYVTIEAKVNSPAPYDITLVFEAETNVELESNDTTTTATYVALNTPYRATLSDSKDVDYYLFTLPQPSAVNVTLATPGNGTKSSSHLYTLFNAMDGNMLSSVSLAGNALVAETGNLYLQNGTYLVQVVKGKTYTDDTYTLTVNASQKENMEAENNNTMKLANPIPLNKDVYASIGKQGDIDCFAFTLSEDAVIQPRFNFNPTDSTSKTYVLTIMEANRNELLTVNIGGKESTKIIAPVALTAGTYYVKVENPKFIQQEYTLHLVCMQVTASENEPNNTTGLASILNIGVPQTGVLSDDKDADYYKLTFATQTAVTLKFSFTQTASKNTTFVLSIEQNGKTQWTRNVKGDSGGMVQELQFPAGEYYIKVKPSTWSSAVYTIAVE